MKQAIKIILAAFIVFSLILGLNGCANTVKTQTVQQRYLVVSATMLGNVDTTNNNPMRYFIFLKYNASAAIGPTLLSPNQQSRVLSASGALSGVDAAPLGVARWPVDSNFQFDEFYEFSQTSRVTSGTFANVISSPNYAVSVLVNPANTIQFAIPLDTTKALPIGINVVVTDSTYIILDYLGNGTSNAGYHLLPTNTVGTTYAANIIDAPPPPASGSADIIKWSVTII